MWDSHVHILETTSTLERAHDNDNENENENENDINLIIMSAKKEEW